MMDSNEYFRRQILLVTHSAISPLPSARNTTLFNYSPPANFPSVRSLLGLPEIKEDLLSPKSRAILQICFLYHCRITEVLHVELSAVIHPDRVILHGAKRSNSYAIYLPGLSEQIYSTEVVDPKVRLFQVSYSKLYRDAVRVGINYRKKSGGNSKRLHSARYIFSNQALPVVDEKELPGLLRHKSNKNYLSYIQ